MFKLLFPTFIYLYLYYSFFLVYATITECSNFITSIYDYAVTSLRALTPISLLRDSYSWSSSGHGYGPFQGLPWLGGLGHATRTPIMSNFSVFSMAFVLGALAVQLCWDIVVGVY
jgi:hypothetical protein